MPQVRWEKNRIWIWDASHFTRCQRVAYAIVDVVTRYWIGYLLTSEQTSIVHLHAAIGYVTPDDEHSGRGPGIRRARAAGMRRAHAERIKHNRATEK